ncbi:aromatic acid exporter family protein [Planosporangium thailandense]|uniref:Aromatic acid exporter family protein n=1 Tax=Planosporangium thailandense TaxID=765197 RepID=A0ABX0XYS2_9ACTN|nr:FUSC family protein [Planosporangium thailandense]NJC70938.1 aromatic acid exporter family protein [Planosporangium thailandense]
MTLPASLMKTAAIRDGLERVRSNAILVIQAGLAAGLAWFVAHDLVGHPRPFFAPVAAVIPLGAALGHRIRRVVELSIGVAVGVFVGDGLIYLMGTGPWQLAVVVALAVTAALFVRGSPVLIIQAASSAVLVATVQPPTSGLGYPRFVDALVGGGVGLLVTALLLPTNPMTSVHRAVEPLIAAIADGFEGVAAALDARDRPAAEQALERLRDTNSAITAYADALAASREAARLSPVWRRSRARMTRYAESAPELDRAVRNARVLARRVVALLRDDEPVPVELLTAVEELGAATRKFGRMLERGEEPVAVRKLLICAVRHASRAHEATLGFSGQMTIGQIRFVATDLLRATGMDRTAAEKAVRAASTGRAGDDECVRVRHP